MIPSSIFDVPRNKEDLVSTNQGQANLRYDEVASLRNIIDSDDVSNFGNGLATWRWSFPTGTWWIPSRSYFRIDCELSKADGSSLRYEDDIAPNMGLGSCLFSKLQYLISDRVISEISEFVPQVDAMKKRLKYTGEWLNTTGANCNMWDASFSQRQNKVIVNGLDFDALRYEISAITDPSPGAGRVPTWIDLDAGGAGPNQIEFIAAGEGPSANLGAIVFTDNGGQAIPDLSRLYSVGQIIYINDGGEKTALIKGIYKSDPGGDDEYDIILIEENFVNDVGAANIVNQFREPVRNINQKESNTAKSQIFSLIWRPPLSIMDIPYAIPGQAKHEFRFTPFSNGIYQKNAIESTLEGKEIADFSFKVKNMLFYAARCEGPIVEMDQFFLDLTECRVQSSELTTKNRSQFSLDVSPSTHALTVAFQDGEVDTNTLYSQTKFKMRRGSSDVAQSALISQELGLTNFYIRYGGLQKPQPDYRLNYSDNHDGTEQDDESLKNSNNLIEVQARGALYNGAYYDASSETSKEWRERGMYLHFPWPKAGSDRSTRLYVSTEFRELVDDSGEDIHPRLLVFNHFKKVCILRYANGNLNEILVNEV